MRPGSRYPMTTSGVCRTLKALTHIERSALGIPGDLHVRDKRLHSGWRAICRVVDVGVLVDHDHDRDVDADTGHGRSVQL